MTTTEDPRFYSVEELAEILSVSKMTVYRRIELGELRAFRIGRTLRVSQADFNRFMRFADTHQEISPSVRRRREMQCDTCGEMLPPEAVALHTGEIECGARGVC